MKTLQHLLNKLPKVELHLHLEGSVEPETLIELAAKHNVSLPSYEQPEELYEFDNDLEAFLEVYRLVCASIRDREDFQRTTYECLRNCACSGARYVELFYSPQAHYPHGVDYPTSLDGVIAGIHQAKKELGIECRVLPGVNRELDPHESLEFVKTIILHKRPEVIGIGLDFYEGHYPPELHQEAFNLARQNGLCLTAHAAEAGPAENVKKSLEILGCQRIDHGYRIVEDEEIMKACVEKGTVFTVCPTTSTITTHWHDLASDDHAIKLMVQAGLKVMINSDDPHMLGTDLGNEYLLLVEKMGFTLSEIKQFILNGVEAAWISDSQKQTWLQDWAIEIDDLIASFA